MSIVATLLGLGVGAFDNLATPDRVAGSQIMDAMRAARLFAVRQRAPATVLIDPPNGTVYGLGLAAAGNWHFEDDDGTGWPTSVSHAPGALVRDGVIGSALRIGPDEGLLIGDLPASFNSPNGFGVDVFVRPDSDVRPMTLLERAGSWSLRLDDEDQLEVRVMLAAKPTAEEFRRTLTGLAIPTDRFTQITVVCDGRSLHIAIDGARVGEDSVFSTPRRVLTAADAGITTGTDVRRFRGLIDELRVGAIVAGDHEPLPPQVLLAGAPRQIHVDAFGHLDPGWHRAPEIVSFESGDPPYTTHVEFGLLGDVRSWRDP